MHYLPLGKSRKVLLLAGLLLTTCVLQANADEVADCGALLASPFEEGYHDTGVEMRDVQLNRAEDVCKTAIQASPDSNQAKAWLARIHFYYSEYAEAIVLLEPAAAAGNPLAQQMLGDILIDGLGGTPVDEKRGVELLASSSAAGFAPGQNSLGVSYERGQGVAKDLPRAAKLYGAAAKQGMAVAQVNLGILYADGNGIAENDERAAQLFMSAAAKGDSGGMNNLAVSYESGEGLDQNYDLAMGWYHKAADAGSTVALANIGNLYAEGLGVKQDYNKALKWMGKAATAGSSYGLYLLGGMYENGKGVTADKARATDLYEQAEEAGSTDAADALDRLAAAD
ncbi:tetratricopeptide repeat protein [Devosia sp. 2618]|uniref:tetratricopeptide repeat protein n=1 Tax=Devosia sp. 2618 TaxID=3156454 RepID=UPI0033995D13